MFSSRDRAARRVERRLFAVGRELAAAREELEIVRAQLVSLGEDAEETATQALVSENSADRRHAREAAGHQSRLASRGVALEERIAHLLNEQNELLAKLVV